MEKDGMKMNVTQKLNRLREEMKERKIDAYIIPSDDFHQSEYVGEYFHAREYISGFTGSAGTVVVGPDWAGLWTDGRYFIQAEQQLAGSEITLFRSGVEGVPTIEEHLKETLPENGTVGFDGRVISENWGEELRNALREKNITFRYDKDLVNLIWKERPALSKAPVFLLDEKYAGESAASKLARVRTVMEDEGADYHLVASLAEICWLYNIRGGDVAYTPVVLSYTLISADKAILFIDKDKLSVDVRAYLDSLGMEIWDYEEVYDYIATLGCDKDNDRAIESTGDSGETKKETESKTVEEPVEIAEKTTIWIDPHNINYTLYQLIPEQIKKVEKPNPIIRMKAIKNSTEIANTKMAYIKDGVACVKFMCWMKENVGKIPMTEISAADKLESLRREQEHCLDLSFDTIAGYQEHGAIVHYSATEETDKELKPEGMILVDSGGHYLEGTTDITRTIILGAVTKEQKEHYTAVLRSMLDLAMAKFLYGCSGSTLDMIARQPLWELDLDYRHGTGHGVGYLLSVHEGPAAFRWENANKPQNQPVLEEGMILTDEPGLYIQDSHGIRTENQLVVKKGIKNDYGQFMEFENITKTPIDLDGVLPEMLTQKEKDYLNAYHANVYEVISPFLDKNEKEWLQKYTRKI